MELQYVEKRGLVERLRGVKRGVFSADHPYNPFQGEYPLPRDLIP